MKEAISSEVFTKYLSRTNQDLSGTITFVSKIDLLTNLDLP